MVHQVLECQVRGRLTQHAVLECPNYSECHGTRKSRQFTIQTSVLEWLSAFWMVLPHGWTPASQCFMDCSRHIFSLAEFIFACDISVVGADELHSATCALWGTMGRFDVYLFSLFQLISIIYFSYVYFGYNVYVWRCLKYLEIWSSKT